MKDIYLIKAILIVLFLATSTEARGLSIQSETRLSCINPGFSDKPFYVDIDNEKLHYIWIYYQNESFTYYNTYKTSYYDGKRYSTYLYKGKNRSPYAYVNDNLSKIFFIIDPKERSEGDMEFRCRKVSSKKETLSGKCKEYKVVDVRQLNLRDKPHKPSKVIGRVNKGDRVCIYKFSGKWGRTNKGWISRKYLKPVSGSRNSKSSQRGNKELYVENIRVDGLFVDRVYMRDASSQCDIDFFSTDWIDDYKTSCLKKKNSKGVQIYCTRNKKLCKTFGEVTYVRATGDLPPKDISMRLPKIKKGVFNFAGGMKTVETFRFFDNGVVEYLRHNTGGPSLTYKGKYNSPKNPYWIHNNAVCYIKNGKLTECTSIIKP